MVIYFNSHPQNWICWKKPFFCFFCSLKYIYCENPLKVAYFLFLIAHFRIFAFFFGIAANFAAFFAGNVRTGRAGQDHWDLFTGVP